MQNDPEDVIADILPSGMKILAPCAIEALTRAGYAVVARKDLGLHVKKLDGAGFQDWVSPEIRAATKEKVE